MTRRLLSPRGTEHVGQRGGVLREEGVTALVHVQSASGTAAAMNSPLAGGAIASKRPDADAERRGG